ncbi:MAG: hypothetical protein IJK04_09330 [Kiritimatiellae bacterium]|nr:hypothetical protein [Kiritimatiellia bacterium]
MARPRTFRGNVPTTTDVELVAKYDEAVKQLTRYRADKSVPSLARGTVLHQIVYQFRGDNLIRCEQIAAPGGTPASPRRRLYGRFRSWRKGTMASK